MPTATVAAVDSREEADRVTCVEPTPASLPETAQPDADAESDWTPVWVQEDLVDRGESGEGKLGKGARGRDLCELFFVGEIEP